MGKYTSAALMEIKKNIRLAYRIEQKADGGFIAKSDDPGVEPIEAATKVELFQKMRAKTAALIGSEIPLHLDHAPGAPVVNILTKQVEPAADYAQSTDLTPLEERRSGLVNVWKIAFFVLLAAMIVWFVLHAGFIR